MPWTMTSLSKLMAKGTYDDESRPRRKHWPRSKPEKRKTKRPITMPGGPHEPASSSVPGPRLMEVGSDEELIPDRDMKKRGRPDERDLEEDQWDPDRLLQDVEHLPDLRKPLIPTSSPDHERMSTMNGHGTSDEKAT